MISDSKLSRYGKKQSNDAFRELIYMDVELALYALTQWFQNCQLKQSIEFFYWRRSQDKGCPQEQYRLIEGTVDRFRDMAQYG